ncbi:hypothetical protein Q3O60_14280 [Alkalimonas collagenimarina]|uniref:Lipoprotein n=1 Tax=Alkalimonas collagenimarina TaxID=400390 RepID=A0ABT9H215_9GAMM|nr:hypothetical protein [Alkalimonas collagenimarina]MDP4537357.1 hypothetical protein [Alkalimonas collagenimarina]
MNHQNRLYFLIISVLILAACDKRPDIEVLEQRFYQHQTQFEVISKVACSIRSELNTRWLRYEVNSGEQFSDSLSEEFQMLDQLMTKIGAEHIVLQQKGAPGCTLHITQWSSAFAGSGITIGFSFQPTEIIEYHPDLYDTKGTPEVERKEIRFTKPLASGWYIEYHKYG